MQIIGLILDIIGAILLYAGTEILNKTILGIMSNMNGTSGVGAFLKDLGNMTVISFNKQRADKFSKAGLILIILGFIFQLIGSA